MRSKTSAAATSAIVLPPLPRKLPGFLGFVGRRSSRVAIRINPRFSSRAGRASNHGSLPAGYVSLALATSASADRESPLGFAVIATNAGALPDEKLLVALQ